MAIPGVKPELPLRSKVRVGARTDKGYPTALDYFACPDPDFERLAGVKPKTLRVSFPYADATECVSSGLEKWMKARSGPLLGCYTKGDGTAHRLGNERLPDGTIKLDPTVKGLPRNDMPCAAQNCPYYGPGDNQGCRPIARLNFFLADDDRRDSVFRFETKSLHTIETLEGVLGQYPDCRDRVFILTAERRTTGAKHYTVVSIAEERASEAAQTMSEQDYRVALKGELQRLDQWPPSEAVIDWVKRVGPEVAWRKVYSR